MARPQAKALCAALWLGGFGCAPQDNPRTLDLPPPAAKTFDVLGNLDDAILPKLEQSSACQDQDQARVAVANQRVVLSLPRNVEPGCEYTVTLSQMPFSTRTLTAPVIDIENNSDGGVNVCRFTQELGFRSPRSGGQGCTPLWRMAPEGPAVLQTTPATIDGTYKVCWRISNPITATCPSKSPLILTTFTATYQD